MKVVRSLALLTLLVTSVWTPLAVAQTPSPKAPVAAQAMLGLDPRGESLAKRVGTWQVTSTLRLTPDAKPIVQTAVADRVMIGPYLQEIMRAAPNAGGADFRRISYLTYFRVEGRWHYVSLDTRFPVGIMPAYSFDGGESDKIVLQFEPLAFVGLGDKVEGRMIRSNFVITWDGPDHDTARQYWVAADGSGQKWLAVQYDYVRVKK
jgi:hypothetical protein